MTVPTNVRIQRLHEQNRNLRDQLDKMTEIADGFNIQLRILYLHLGHEEFNRIVNQATKETRHED
jgi:hypothetical protein